MLSERGHEFRNSALHPGRKRPADPDLGPALRALPRTSDGDRDAAEIQTEIDGLIQERDAIRPWGWNTGRNWKDDLPKDVLDKLMKE
jgi:hypothetical protein